MAKNVFAFDSQRINTFQSCPQKYKLEHVDLWRPVHKPDYFENGDLMHRMLKHYYLAKQSGRTAKAEEHALVVHESIEVARRAATLMDISSAQAEEDIRHFKDYVLRWQYDGWEILSVEKPFSKKLYEDDNTIIILDGVIDLVVRAPQGVAVVDHKTSSRRGTPLPLSNQFMLYSWSTGIQDVIINKIGYQKTLKPEERFTRPWMHYMNSNLKEWSEDTINWAFKMIKAVETSDFPHNLTSCDKYSGCLFAGVCSQTPASRAFSLQAHFFKGEPWSPYTRDLNDGEKPSAHSPQVSEGSVGQEGNGNL